MNERLDDGDRAAAMLYVEQLQDLGKNLKDRQDRFEGDLRRFLNGDQIKAYKKWREDQDQAADRKRRDNQRRWDEAGFRGEFVAPGAAAPEIKTALPTPPGVAAASDCPPPLRGGPGGCRTWQIAAGRTG